MLKKFARLFETEEYGQLLLKMDVNENGNPENKLYFTAEHLGVCSISASSAIDDSEKAFEVVEKLFNRFDEDAAIKMVKAIVDGLKLDEIDKR